MNRGRCRWQTIQQVTKCWAVNSAGRNSHSTRIVAVVGGDGLEKGVQSRRSQLP